jgi:hypothetical protein
VHVSLYLSQITVDELQVLPRRLSYKLEYDRIDALTLYHCPSRRIVESSVPIMAVNDDESPCGKRGGFALVTTKFVKVRSLATNIPLSIEIDCKDFDSSSRVFVRDLVMPKGQVLVKPAPDVCLLRMEIGV